MSEMKKRKSDARDGSDVAHSSGTEVGQCPVPETGAKRCTASISTGINHSPALNRPVAVVPPMQIQHSAATSSSQQRTDGEQQTAGILRACLSRIEESTSSLHSHMRSVNLPSRASSPLSQVYSPISSPTAQAESPTFTPPEAEMLVFAQSEQAEPQASSSHVANVTSSSSESSSDSVSTVMLEDSDYGSLILAQRRNRGLVIRRRVYNRRRRGGRVSGGNRGIRGAARRSNGPNRDGRAVITRGLRTVAGRAARGFFRRSGPTTRSMNEPSTPSKAPSSSGAALFSAAHSTGAGGSEDRSPVSENSASRPVNTEVFPLNEILQVNVLNSVSVGAELQDGAIMHTADDSLIICTVSLPSFVTD